MGRCRSIPEDALRDGLNLAECSLRRMGIDSGFWIAHYPTLRNDNRRSG